MKTVAKILNNVAVMQVIGDKNAPVNAIQQDSRKVVQGDCFVAIRGTAIDSHQFIADVILRGATCIVCEALPDTLPENVTFIQVEDSSVTLGKIASNFFDNPSASLALVGVTGTNGKTSVATLLYEMFSEFGNKVGLLSTVENKIGKETIPSTHTTPDAVSLNLLLKKMVDENCNYCFMEVSSHAVAQNRIEGLHFAGAIFTNLTHDHLDYHLTFSNYLKAKKGFFDKLPKTAFALVNVDDRNGSIMLQNSAAKKYTYALKTPADFKCKIIDNSIIGLQLDINNVDFHTRLIGEFNAYNLTAVYASAILLGVEKMEAMITLSRLLPPAGRFQQVTCDNSKIVGIVDYAHTPDALKNVIHTIRAIKNDNEKLITVVGCGGDRDKAKRPIMAHVAAHLSDQCIITSDNPRSENPNTIIEEMLSGVEITDRKKVLMQADRKEAIRTAIRLANENDIVLIAGKGHEKYQEIKGVKYPFDDVQIVHEALLEL